MTNAIYIKPDHLSDVYRMFFDRLVDDYYIAQRGFTRPDAEHEAMAVIVECAKSIGGTDIYLAKYETLEKRALISEMKSNLTKYNGQDQAKTTKLCRKTIRNHQQELFG